MRDYQGHAEGGQGWCQEGAGSGAIEELDGVISGEDAVWRGRSVFAIALTRSCVCATMFDMDGAVSEFPPYYRRDDLGVEIIHADCLDVMRAFVAAGRQFGCVLADPPYGLDARESNPRGATARKTRRTWSVWRPLQLWFETIYDLSLQLAPTIFMFCNAKTLAMLFPLAWVRYPLNQIIVWDKGRIGLGNWFRCQTEYILFSHSHPEVAKVSCANLLRVPPLHTSKRIHQSEKPVELLTSLLSPVEGPVLDPFMGSGSTLEAAAGLGRLAVGVEIEESNCIAASERLAAIPLRGLE